MGFSNRNNLNISFHVVSFSPSPFSLLLPLLSPLSFFPCSHLSPSSPALTSLLLPLLSPLSFFPCSHLSPSSPALTSLLLPLLSPLSFFPCSLSPFFVFYPTLCGPERHGCAAPVCFTIFRTLTDFIPRKTAIRADARYFSFTSSTRPAAMVWPMSRTAKLPSSGISDDGSMDSGFCGLTVTTAASPLWM
ncbi:hypothetical protein SAMN05444342_3205 [Haladaptatus paucihalophilus DX253]|uniref:Uncharacterized protein n=1 Tax=Haladaptatus paucihalophilus DX253 TaxID=797209 RepID=A0A1M6YMG9_HALPU|nr:hypothetical protein SAMN05444342_3205 [Haladaptatus paucihalophilus DX253]